MPQATADAHFRQAAFVVLGDRGLMIEGASGAGKSALALALLRQAGAMRRHAALIGDDGAWLGVHAGRVVARRHDATVGLIEMRAIGIMRLDAGANAASGIVDVAVRLVAPGLVERLPEPATEVVLGVALPLLSLPERDAQANAARIAFWLGMDRSSAPRG